MKKVFLLFVLSVIVFISNAQIIEVSGDIDYYDINTNKSTLKKYSITFDNSQIKQRFVGDTLLIDANNQYFQFAIKLLPINGIKKGNTSPENINYELSIPEGYPPFAIYLAGDDGDNFFDNFSEYYEANISNINNVLSASIKFRWIGDDDNITNLVKIENLKILK